MSNLLASRSAHGEKSQRFLAWLDRRPNRPFFAFLNYMEPYLPHYAPQEFSQKFVKQQKKLNFESFVRQDPINPAELQGWNEEYDALTAYLDSQLK